MMSNRQSGMHHATVPMQTFMHMYMIELSVVNFRCPKIGAIFIVAADVTEFV